MANGWAEFHARTRRQHESGRVNHAALWSDFVKLCETSRLAPILQHAIKYGQVLPADSRSAFALMMALLLAPLEWPLDWEPSRQNLVSAMESVLRATDPQMPDSFSVLLELREDVELHLVGHAVLHSALNLLRTPCRRDELRFVARLCNVGHASCLRAYRRALARWRGQTMPGALFDARTRYVVAFEHYALAARELNSALGAVLFEGLDTRLEPPET